MSKQEAESYYQSHKNNGKSKKTLGRDFDLWHNKKEFIICNSCLWCTSSVSGCSSINTCSVCRSVDVHTIPIFDNDNNNTIISRSSSLLTELIQ